MQVEAGSNFKGLRRVGGGFSAGQSSSANRIQIKYVHRVTSNNAIKNVAKKIARRFRQGFPVHQEKQAHYQQCENSIQPKEPIHCPLGGFICHGWHDIGERLFGKYGIDNCGYFFAALFGLRQTDINPIFMVKAVMDGEVISAAAFATGYGFGAGGA